MKQSIWVLAAAAIVATVSSASSVASGRVIAELSLVQSNGSEAACDSYQTTERIRIYADGEVQTSSSIWGIRCDLDGVRYPHGYTSPPVITRVAEADLPGLLEKLRVARSSQRSVRGATTVLSISIEGSRIVHDSNDGARSIWDDLRGAVRSVEMN